MMIEFAHPWALLALPLPFIIGRLVPAYKVKQSGLKVPFFTDLARLLGERPSEGSVALKPAMWQRIALIIGWLLIVAALTKPILLGKPQVREEIGRDLMVVVDLSGSMAHKDFPLPDNSGKVSRLTAVKTVMDKFAEDRKGDRLGLILFGDAAYLQAPFTEDHAAWTSLLNETHVAMAGKNTHLGDALGLAIKIMSKDEKKDREKVVIVLTDGNDTQSSVPPLEAAKIAKAKGIRIHVIAVGDPRTVGEQALDMKTINGIAHTTGGRSFQAMSQVELKQITDQLNKLEPSKYKSFVYQPKVSRHYLPIAIMVVMYLLLFVIATVVRTMRYRKEHHEDESHV